MIQLLIVTSQNDIHSDMVIKELRNSRIEPIRLNSDTIIQESSYSFSWDQQGQVTSQSLTLKDSKRSTQEVKLIWWRKPKDYHPYLNVTDEWARKYAIEETKSLVQSLLGLFPNAKWINNYYNLRLPSRRINQIPLAKQLGILIPPTLVTNQYEPIVSFLKQYGSCIIKPMDYSGFLHDEKQYACYTRPIDLETVDSLRDSSILPLFLSKNGLLKKQNIELL